MLFPYHKSKVAIKLAKSWEFELEAFISMHEEGFSCVSHHLIMALKVALIRSTDGNIFAVVGEKKLLAFTAEIPKRVHRVTIQA